jgi:hypothetical protein
VWDCEVHVGSTTKDTPSEVLQAHQCPRAQTTDNTPAAHMSSTTTSLRRFDDPTIENNNQIKRRKLAIKKIITSNNKYNKISNNIKLRLGLKSWHVTHDFSLDGASAGRSDKRLVDLTGQALRHL